VTKQTRCRISTALLVAILLVTTAGCRRHPVVALPATIAKAPRKDVNVVLVVDRSGSLKVSASCTPLIESAQAFVNQFTPGRDKLGLVTFAASTYVNFPIANTFQTANPNIATILSHIDCAGATSTAQALWTGYQQLIGLNQPDAVNVILFFTDGAPTGATFDMPIAASSPCSEYTPGSPDGPGAYAIPPTGKGYIRGVYGTFTNVSQWFGLLDPNGAAGPDGFQLIKNNDMQPAAHSKDCAYFVNWPSNMTRISDFLGVPTKDIYGNSANTTFQPVTLNADGLIDITNAVNAQAVALNTADSAATRIRSGAVDPVSGRGLPNVLIYSIGLGNAPYPISSSFLERVSADPRSGIFRPGERAGQYIRVTTVSGLQSVFSVVASQILRRAE
jgi:hypothetical protein